jgi:hypothetical protein
MTSAVQQQVSLLASHFQGGGLLPPQTLGIASTHASFRESTGPAPGTRQIILGDPGSCPAAGTSVYVVLDESASVASADGNDPLSRRHRETAFAIAHVASACRCRHDRVALFPFDVGSPGQVPPQPLTSPGVRRLRQGLRSLSTGYGMSSSLLPALTHVEQHAARRSGALALVVFSDFLLTDQFPAAAMTRMCAFPGSVHAVVLGAAPPPVLLQHPGVTITRLTPRSPPGAAAQAVFDGLTRQRTHRTTGAASPLPPPDNPCDRTEDTP